MINNTSKQKGSRGETIAAHYLTKNNYHIIKQNYFKKWGEIDIIAQKNSSIIFIEVKSRITKHLQSSADELPEAAISSLKISKIKRTAQFFIKESRLSPDKNYRFDVIAILFNHQTAYIKHLKYAF